MNKHIGDIGRSKILHKAINGIDFYGITADDKNLTDKEFYKNEKPVICFIQTKHINILGGDYLYIENVFTEQQYRNQNYAKNLLFFLRNVEQKSFIFGNKQSQLGQEFNKSVARSGRFPMFWLNVKTGEKHDYDVEKDNYNLKPYRSQIEETDWVLMAEGCGKNWMDRFYAKTPEEGSNWWHRSIIYFEENKEYEDF